MDAPWTITATELQLNLEVESKTISFLTNTGATHSTLSSFIGQHLLADICVAGIGGTISRPSKMALLLCQLQGHIFSQAFLVIMTYPILLLGRDTLTKLPTTLTIPGATPNPITLLLPLLTPHPLSLLKPTHLG